LVKIWMEAPVYNVPETHDALHDHPYTHTPCILSPSSCKRVSPYHITPSQVTVYRSGVGHCMLSCYNIVVSHP
jgi:hypothetical protein